jgi:hypothetical protein
MKAIFIISLLFTSVLHAEEATLDSELSNIQNIVSNSSSVLHSACVNYKQELDTLKDVITEKWQNEVAQFVSQLTENEIKQADSFVQQKKAYFESEERDFSVFDNIRNEAEIVAKAIRNRASYNVSDISIKGCSQLRLETWIIGAGNDNLEPQILLGGRELGALGQIAIIGARCLSLKSKPGITDWINLSAISEGKIRGNYYGFDLPKECSQKP